MERGILPPLSVVYLPGIAYKLMLLCHSKQTVCNKRQCDNVYITYARVHYYFLCNYLKIISLVFGLWF